MSHSMVRRYAADGISIAAFCSGVDTLAMLALAITVLIGLNARYFHESMQI